MQAENNSAAPRAQALARFARTHWSTVLAAAHGDDALFGNGFAGAARKGCCLASVDQKMRRSRRKEALTSFSSFVAPRGVAWGLAAREPRTHESYETNES
jgi:hypothetical protein